MLLSVLYHYNTEYACLNLSPTPSPHSCSLPLLPPALPLYFPPSLPFQERDFFFLFKPRHPVAQAILPLTVARAGLELLILSPLSSRYHHVLVILSWDSGSGFGHVRPAFYKLSYTPVPRLGIFKAQENSLQPSGSVVNSLALFHLFYFTFSLWSKSRLQN